MSLALIFTSAWRFKIFDTRRVYTWTEMESDYENIATYLNDVVQEKIREIFKFNISMFQVVGDDGKAEFKDEKTFANKILDNLFKERHWMHNIEFFLQMLDLLNDEAAQFAIWGKITTIIEDIMKDINEFLETIKSAKNQRTEETLNKIACQVTQLEPRMEDMFGENSGAFKVLGAKIRKVIESTFGKLVDSSDLRMNAFSGEVRTTSYFEEFQNTEDEELGEQIVNTISENKLKFFDIFALFLEIASVPEENEEDEEDCIELETFKEQTIKLKKLLRQGVEAVENKNKYYEEIGFLARNIQKFFEEEFLEDPDSEDDANDLDEIHEFHL